MSTLITDHAADLAAKAIAAASLGRHPSSTIRVLPLQAGDYTHELVITNETVFIDTLDGVADMAAMVNEYINSLMQPNSH